MAWFDFIKGFFYNPSSKEDRYEDVAELLEVLKSLTEDLLFTSESDFPFEVFHWELKTEDVLLENLHHYIENMPKDEKVETLTVEKVLRSMSKSRAYYSAEKREKANRFKQVIAFFSNQVSDAKVFKVGKVEKTVYILGKVAGIHIIGLKTIAVET